MLLAGPDEGAAEGLYLGMWERGLWGPTWVEFATWVGPPPNERGGSVSSMSGILSDRGIALPVSPPPLNRRSAQVGVRRRALKVD